MAIPDILPTTGASALVSVVFVISSSVLLACALTWLSSTINYHIAVLRFNQASRSYAASKKAGATKDDSLKPTPMFAPTLPYSLPWLGSGLAFVNDNPGSFFRMVQRKFKSASGSQENLEAMSMLLGGEMAHVFASPDAIQALFKDRGLSRRRFNRDVGVKGFGLPHEDDVKLHPWAFPNKAQSGSDNGAGRLYEMQHTLWDKYLISATAVNTLTQKFMEVLKKKFDKPGGMEQEVDHSWKEVNVIDYMKNQMFIASTTALMGTKILELNPDFSKQYWEFDRLLLQRFYGFPKILAPRAYQVLDEFLEGVEKWVKYTQQLYDAKPPMEPEWEETMGAKVIRARHKMYAECGLSVRAFSSLDSGFLFGLSSNAIPATSWTLAHLLAPTNAKILAQIYAELPTAQKADGSIDIPTLMSLPYLNSAFSETLRMYVDVLVTREVPCDMTFGRYIVKKGDILMAPTFLSHRDPDTWAQNDMPPENVWYAERFLKEDEKTGKPIYSTAGTAGKFFPFGGGSQICPGRTFARQEAVSAVAIFLLSFDVEFLEYMRPNQKGVLVGVGPEPGGAPVVKRQHTGNGVVSAEGDVRVRIRRRQ